LNCDICGREIIGQPFRVRVEGAKMLVCNQCERLGKPYEEPPVTARRPLRTRPLPSLPRRRAPELPREMHEFEVAEDYGERVRRHRMKSGLSQDVLAKRVKEKLSVIQKIETGKMIPDTRLCRALEHELRVKLLVPRKEVSPVPKTAAPTAITLGEIARIKGESQTERSD